MKKNDYNIWLNTNTIYNKCKFCALLSSFVVWASIFIAMLFPVFGIGLAFFIMCFLCIGFKKNIINCLQNKSIKVESVFDYYKFCIPAFCLRVCSYLLIALWSLLLIVPGIITGLNYSFAPYIFSENPSLGTLECLSESKNLTYGYRGEIFLIYLIQTLLIILIALFSYCLIIILNYIVIMPLWFNILIPTFITIFVFLIFVLPYFEIMMANIYLTVKNQKIKTLKQKNTKTASTM